MEAVKAPRGTRDILGEESWKWAYVTGVCRDVADDYGYKEVHLPIFEHTELFCRGVGDTTDIVEKEMYTFTDKGGRSVTLRPELTASMVRSYIENEMSNGAQPAKLWGIGPMFRYERPQKGRYRQFVQLDIEALGAQDALVDLEVIDFSMELYRRLGLRNLQVVLNSVGCPKCRPVYRSVLQDFLSPRFDELCDTCKSRFDRNPLRILDCKSPICKEITKDAPAVTDCLCDECREHYERLNRGLEKIGASVVHDKRLVRGLDYYTKTAYEIQSGDLGAQNAVCGGGRYDNLAEAIGGPHVPGVGFASGIERVVLTMEAQGCSFGEKPESKVYVVAAEPSARLDAMVLLRELRMNRISADMDYMGRSMKGQMKAAGAAAGYACIIGTSEIEKGVVTVKNLKEGAQEELTAEQLINKLK
ncbi:MAG: histidine--tRNA ligase [Synergistes jonesii]|uniref:histidine--tRNA ligase n=1 Tax=Synergistes jonesii TaxID=2754 RepID=UPI002A75647D|nr:histidine--tRNA ligase [Synergistes jonesii]MDY2984385.1 histidine--tRNA ligase [Synergistes jonesii]